MATFSEVLAVLGDFYSLPNKVAENQLRGRIQNFQKLGVPIGLQLGKGRKINYEREQIYQLVLCLELSELGFLPANIANLLKSNWEIRYWKAFEIALEGKAPFIYFHINVMTNTWSESDLDNRQQFVGLEWIFYGEPDPKRLKDFRHMSVLNIGLIADDIEKLLAGILPPYKSAER